jgi:hypothetical protein
MDIFSFNNQTYLFISSKFYIIFLFCIQSKIITCENIFNVENFGFKIKINSRHTIFYFIIWNNIINDLSS